MEKVGLGITEPTKTPVANKFNWRKSPSDSGSPAADISFLQKPISSSVAEMNRETLEAVALDDNRGKLAAKAFVGKDTGFVRRGNTCDAKLEGANKVEEGRMKT